MKNIEILLTNRCNCKCIFCHTPQDINVKEFNIDTCKKILKWGKKAGAEGVYFGGGEPTVKEDLLEIVSFANGLNYKTIKLLSNGIKISDNNYLKKLVNAGITEFKISLFGHTSKLHDSLTKIPGSFGETVNGIKNIVKIGKYIEVVFLITTESFKHLSEVNRLLKKIGVRKVHFWLLSLFDIDKNKTSHFLPNISEIIPYVVDSIKIGKKIGIDVVLNHIPKCFLPLKYRDMLFDIKGAEIFVIALGNKFKVEDSPYEGGVKIEKCLSCKENINCLGLRADYLEKFGKNEIKPIK